MVTDEAFLKRVRKEAKLWLGLLSLIALSAPIVSISQWVFSLQLHPEFAHYSDVYRALSTNLAEKTIGWTGWVPAQWIVDLYIVRLIFVFSFIKYAMHPEGHIKWTQTSLSNQLAMLLLPGLPTYVIVREIRFARSNSSPEKDNESYIGALIGINVLQLYLFVMGIGAAVAINALL